MSDNVNIIVQDTINEIVVNTAVIVETIDINVQVAVDEVNIIANPNNYVVNINRIIGEQVQSDWDQNDDQEPDYIKNKPSIPTLTSDLTNDGEDGVNPFITANDVTPQVNSDWNATSGVAEILNKPSIPSISGLATVVYVDQQDALKVDKVVGKGLSENDFTNTLKTKLDGIESGAQVNVNADWNATTGDAEILNKPTIPAAQVNSNWNATSGVAEILNKPTIPSIDGLATVVYVDQQDALKVDKVAGSRLITSAESTLLGNTSGINTGDQDLSNLVVKNSAIVGATKTKITFDAKGLVTSGADATTADIADSLNKRYVTDANLTTIGNQSGVNTGDETTATIKTKLGITTLSGSNTGDQDLSGLTPNTRSISTTTPLQGGGDLSANRTLSILQSNTTQSGFLSNTDWNTFNGKFNLPALTSGSVLFSNGTTIAQDNANFFWDNTNKRLGIGTTSPTAKLHVKAPGALSTDIAFRVRNSADSGDLMTVNGLGGLNVSGDIDARLGTIGFKFNQNGGSPQIEFWQAVARFTLTRTSNNGLDFSSNVGYCAHVSTAGTLIGGTARTDLNASAQLEVISTTKGFLPPRMTTAQKNAIVTPATGLVVFDTTLNKLCVRGASAWETITSV